MSSAAPLREPVSVLAVVATRNVTPWLEGTLSAILRQSTPPDRVLVAVWDPTALAAVRDAAEAAGLAGVDVLPAANAATFGAAVRAVLRDRPGARGQWLWLLHDDSAPEPDALTQLRRAAEQGSSVAVVGAKQVEWTAPDELISVGVGMTRSGRRFTALEEHEIDQGQYDDRSDVLAVGTAGALVRRDVWDALSGTDPALGPFGDGADLARRARLAGHRVVIAPGATVRHARASYFALRAPRHGESAVDAAPEPERSWPARRQAVLHARLAGATPMGAVLAFLGMYLLAPVRALGRLVTKEFHLVGAELRAPFAATAGLSAVSRARRQARRTSVLPRRVLRPLQVGLGERLATWRDQRLQRAALRRAARARSELEIREAAALARRRRTTLSLVVLAMVAVALVTVGSWILAGPLVGGALLPVDGDVHSLWTLATSPWLAVGDGHAVLAEPFLLVLAALTTLIGGLWGTPVTVVLTALLVGALPLAAIGAWFAAGAATRSVGVRAWVAGAWALMPPLLTAVADGRVGAVVAHLALPWVALGVARGLGVQRRDVVLSGMVGAQRVHRSAVDDAATTPALALTSGRRSSGPVGSIGACAAAGLAFAVACAGAPLLLPLGLVLLAVLAMALPRRARRLHAGRGRLVLVAVPALALLGPWLTAPFTSAAGADGGADQLVRLLLSEPGAVEAFTVASPWQSALLWPLDPAPVTWLPSALAWLPLALAAPVVLAALAALLRGGAQAVTVRIGWLLAVLALAAAVTLPLVGVGTDVDGGVESSVGTWPGPALSLALLGALLAAAVAGEGMRRRLGGATFGWRQSASAVLVALAALGPAAGAVTWVLAVRSDPGVVEVAARGADPVPALGRQVQVSAASARVLSLTPTADGLDVQLWRADGPQLVDGALTTLALTGSPLSPEIAAPDAADADLAVAVSRLTVAADEAVPALLTHGVAVVVVANPDSTARPGADPSAAAALAAELDATAGLEKVTTNASGSIWRVVADVAARARVLEADGTGSPDVVVTSRDLPVGGLTSGVIQAGGEILAGEADRTVVLAERSDPGWVARLDGVTLEPVTTDWRQAWTLPAGASGQLEISYADPVRTPWVVVQIVVLGLTLLLALPARRRTPEEVV